MSRGLSTAGNRQLGTATRLTTGMRPSSKSGFSGSSVLNQPFKVEDRLITQQGLGGPKTAKGSRRQIEDKNYYLGILRSKINEIGKELNKLNQQMNETKEESSSFIQYEQMAEKLALEIKNLQGELGDYNTLVDKINTNEDIQALEMDFEEIKSSNERCEKMLEHLFEDKNNKEATLKSSEIELEQERRMAESLVSNMPIEMKNRYERAKEENEHFLKKMSQLQEKLDKMQIKKLDLEEELEQSYIKQQAVKLYNELAELEQKRDQQLSEEQARGDPQLEREKLLKQVKDDNAEISAIERQLNECQERLEILQDELNVVDRDIEDNQGEKMQKYRDLKKREEQMDEFLSNFDTTKEQELSKLGEMECEITALLEKLSRSMSRIVGHVPTEDELRTIQDQLSFKSSEVNKSENTTSTLALERSKLSQDLTKVDQLENKINLEMKTLIAKIKKMETEIEQYSNLDELKRNSDEAKHKLIREWEVLQKRRDYMRRRTQYLSQEYDRERLQLDENETQTQLINLERRWQHLEQNNYVMKEFICSKSMESDYMTVSHSAKKLLEEINSQLRDTLSNRSSL